MCTVDPVSIKIQHSYEVAEARPKKGILSAMLLLKYAS